MNRFTFVVQVHTDGGITTLENLSTHERVRISDLGTVGGQIESWLEEQPDARRRQRAGTERVRPESAPE